MTLVWAVIVIAALIAMGFQLGRYAVRHRPRYIDSAAWADEHWRERHERAKADQQRRAEGL
jgi:uncharacterized membrane protein